MPFLVRVSRELKTDVSFTCTKWDTYDQSNCASKFVNQPNFIGKTHFSEDFVAIELEPLEIEVNKPNYIGMVVLDHARDIIYKFWYGYLKPKFGEKIQ